MSGANKSAAPLPEITLAELERLIRILGRFGSSFDGEILSAARMAQKWVVEHDTDWKTLLTPEPEPGVLAVTAVPDPAAMAKAYEADRVQAYANGYQAGLRAMAQQVKAQASYAQAGGSYRPAGQSGSGLGGSGLGGFNATMSGYSQGGLGGPGFNPTVGGLGAGLGGSGQQPGVGGGQQAGPAQAASGASPGAPPGGGAGTSPGKVWPAGSWQAVAQTLLDRHAQGIPGVLRSREEQFVADILKRGFPSLTPAQETWLRDIAGRNGLSW